MSGCSDELIHLQYMCSVRMERVNKKGVCLYRNAFFSIKMRWGRQRWRQKRLGKIKSLSYYKIFTRWVISCTHRAKEGVKSSDEKMGCMTEKGGQPWCWVGRSKLPGKEDLENHRGALGRLANAGRCLQASKCVLFWLLVLEKKKKMFTKR